MDGLRLALLIIGVVIVAAVYWNARRRNAAEIRNSELSERIEPGFDEPVDVARTDAPLAEALPLEANDDPLLATPDAAEPAPAEPAAASAEDSGGSDDAEEADIPQKVISMRIVGKERKDFAAEDVVQQLLDAGLEHGRFGIFHRMPGDGSEDAVFSVANLTEPGTFDLSDLKDRRFAGLSFFMLRPGPGRGVDAFDKMVEAARAVAIKLQGELLDGDGSTLSIQRERFMREDLIQYELKHLKL